jgi:hypothetical protein
MVRLPPPFSHERSLVADQTRLLPLSQTSTSPSSLASYSARPTSLTPSLETSNESPSTTSISFIPRQPSSL